MGARMVPRLLDAGHDVVPHDENSPAVKRARCGRGAPQRLVSLSRDSRPARGALAATGWGAQRGRRESGPITQRLIGCVERDCIDSLDLIVVMDA